jgi:hypothetical protein
VTTPYFDECIAGTKNHALLHGGAAGRAAPGR